MGDRQVPYSLVSGINLRALPIFARPSPDARSAAIDTRSRSSGASGLPDLGEPLRTLSPESIVLNEWTARELNARDGDTAQLDFYLWDAAGGLRTDTAQFTVAGIVPMAGLAADRRLAPEYPGITEAESLSDWDPPFPIDLSRVRPQDEAYWKMHRTTPKAFLAYERARDLWATRYGALTGLRFAVPSGQDPEVLADALRKQLQPRVTPVSQGLVLTPARRLALDASRGATDFGEYFTYFSFFIVVSALLLVVLFFRLGIEQRLRQIGVLRATGYTVRDLRWMLASEAAGLSLAGGLIGVVGAVGYASAVVYGLKTWWVGAVGTTLLELHVSRHKPSDWSCRRNDRGARVRPAVVARRGAPQSACAARRPFDRGASRDRSGASTAQVADWGHAGGGGVRAADAGIRQSREPGRGVLRGQRGAARRRSCSCCPAG